VLAAALTIACALVLTACSGSSAAPPAPSTSDPLPTASVGAIGPVILTAGAPDGVVNLGRTVVFKLDGDPAAWDLVTPDTVILTLLPGGPRDGAVFNWGAETLTVGRASVVATPKPAADGTRGAPITFSVTVTPAAT
jgi:hypothetical protein